MISYMVVSDATSSSCLDSWPSKTSGARWAGVAAFGSVVSGLVGGRTPGDHLGNPDAVTNEHGHVLEKGEENAPSHVIRSRSLEGSQDSVPCLDQRE